MFQSMLVIMFQSKLVIMFQSMLVTMFQALLAACEDQNADVFSEAVAAYDQISRLDQWHTTLLLRVKKSIEGDVDLR